MKTRKIYRTPMAYVVDVDDENVMATASSFASSNDGFGDDKHHLATDWFNDNAGDGLNVNPVIKK